LKESAVNGIVLMPLIYLKILFFLGRGFPGRPKLPVFGLGCAQIEDPDHLPMSVHPDDRQSCHSMDVCLRLMTA
jgi:hypothetical protein